MNDYETQLRSKWNEINYYDGGSIQLELNHPLEWHVGYFTAGQKALIIVCDSAVENLESSKSISAMCSKRRDGKYAISFALLINDQEDVFITMCSDIIRYSSMAKANKQALNMVIKRYRQWCLLLEHQKSALMSENAQKGLIGELLFLKQKIEAGMALDTALDGWVGPNGSDQDFIYSDGWYEIKTTGIASDEVGISSIEQLDNNEPGELVIMRVDKCAPAKVNAFSLRSLVMSISKILACASGNIEKYTDKLNCAGYVDLPAYDEQKFFFSDESRFKVSDDFPKLKRIKLPIAVTKIEYNLNIPSLQKWGLK